MAANTRAWNYIIFNKQILGFFNFLQNNPVYGDQTGLVSIVELLVKRMGLLPSARIMYISALPSRFD